MYKMFESIQDNALSRRTSDVAYGVLADALPVGKKVGRCCKNKETQGICSLCWWMKSERTPETTRHVAIGCPFSKLAQDAVLRAMAQCTMINADAIDELQNKGWEELTTESARLLITGYKHCPRSRLMAEERVGRTPTRVLVLETLRAIVNRCHRNEQSTDREPIVRCTCQSRHTWRRGRLKSAGEEEEEATRDTRYGAGASTDVA